MAAAHTLQDAEIGIIKTMLQMFPRQSDQAILAYFTRPSRDLNHRLIAEIRHGRWPHIGPAPIVDTLAFLSAFTFVTYPDARRFVQEEDLKHSLTPIASLELHWWPMGQGLFHSGRLRGSAGGAPFNWVYDCGSSSKAAIRDTSITDYRQRFGRHINLVTLSHFDQDHINGIVALLQGVRVDRLVLPYLPFHLRLLAAFADGVDVADPLFGFFVDPATFLTGLEGSNIGEILFVPAAGPDDAAPDEGGGGEPPSGPDLPLEETRIDEGKPPEGFDDDPVGAGVGGPKVRFLRPGGRILLPRVWEFVPYNDAELQPKVTPSFERRARCLARIFTAKPARRAAALKLLKRLYDKTFGGTSKPRNLASLFLYSGPVGDRFALAGHVATAPVHFNRSRDNFAQLSTGDGYLDDAPRLAALYGFYRHGRRFKRAGIFQVMHHGSRNNWHDGVADAVKPAVSIFSSSPTRKDWGHPHAEVLRDFWGWSPVQVDEKRCFHLLATLGVRVP